MNLSKSIFKCLVKCIINLPLVVVRYIDRYILHTLVIVLISFGLLIAYWSFWPYKLVSFYPDHLQTKKDEYTIDEVVSTVYHFKKYSGASPIYLSRWFENSVTLAIPSEIIKADNEKEKLTLKEFDIPDFFEKGKYRICELIRYRVNPIRVVEYHNCSNYFEIVD